VRGELDYAECGLLRSQTERILREDPAAVVVDLSGVEYLDSSGLGMLLSLSQEYGAAGGRLVLVASETVEHILQITRLTGVFTTETDALSALALIKATAPHDGGAVS
jgi:anti-sigma B factor antagonist